MLLRFPPDRNFFQQYNLIPVLNVYENIILPLEIDNKKVDKEYLDKVINILGIENIECLNCGSMVNATTNTAEFDIQIQITYKEV